MLEDEIKGEKEDKEEISPEDLMKLWEDALKEAKVSEETSVSASEALSEKKEEKRETFSGEPAKLQELTPKKETKVYPELDFILDIPLEISVEIGRTRMIIKDLLKLNQGSIIELEKFAGEPVEVYVNGKLMAKGEVVVVNEKFGVRITEIISAQERVRRLGS